MTIIATAARPYANAAFSAAKAANQLTAWSLALQQLSLAVQDTQMKSTLKNPSCTKDQLASLLISFLQKISANGSADALSSIENFIKLLAEKKRLSLLPNIAELFEIALAKEAGYLSLTVTTAYEMNDQKQIEIKETLSKQLHSDLRIQFLVDNSVMGGLLVRSKDWVLDGTIKGQLERLKSVLI